MNTNIILSHLITNDMPVYGNKKSTVLITKNSSIDNGDISNSLNIKIPNHIGTHIDFPNHFCKNGKILQDYNDNFWLFDKIGFIETSFKNIHLYLDDIDKDIEFLIVKTNFEKYRGTDKYVLEQPTVEPSLANVLKRKFKKLRVLGFDMISISSYTNRDLGREAHRSFLCENNLLLVEDMKLKNLTYCPSKLIVSPLLIKDSDGVPCFVYAI